MSLETKHTKIYGTQKEGRFQISNLTVYFKELEEEQTNLSRRRK